MATKIKPPETAGGSSSTNLPVEFEPAAIRPRHDGWTAQRQVAFIEALAETASVEEACRRVGMSRSSAYRLRSRPCGWCFRRAWDAATDFNLCHVEEAMLDRVLNGVPRPIFHNGEQVGERRHFDERLTMFLLRTRRPDRYGKWIEMTPPDPETWDEPAGFLEAELDDIAGHAPREDGNEDDEWA
jgi:hypothetical protein